ncbi:MAG: hypothetical protein HRF49_04015 [bacterium]|jgi:hypothetical protein
MKRRSIKWGSIPAVLAGLASLLLAAATAVYAQSKPKMVPAEFKPPNWEDGTVWNFGIYDKALNRIGTAAYKVVLDPEAGPTNYTIRYNAKSADMAEASTCIVDKKSLLPVRSSRKLSQGGSDYFTNVSYGPGFVKVSKRRDNGAISEETIPADTSANLFDFEQLLPILPQIQWSGRTSVYFYIFIASRRTTSWVTVEDLGPETISYKERIWRCRKLSMRSDVGDQYVWMTIWNGRSRIAKFDGGGYLFIDLDLPSTGTQADLQGKMSLEDAMSAAGAPVG